MRVLWMLAYLCLVSSQVLDTSDSSQALLEWLEKTDSTEKAEGAQQLLDTLILNLIESKETSLVGELIDALQEKTEKRSSDLDQTQQPINHGRLGHCCKGGELTVSYKDKEATIPQYHSTQIDSYTKRVYYTGKVITLKVPVWTCATSNVVCCHGYVSITRLPGALAAIGKNNCVDSKTALFTIIQMQLLEKIYLGHLTVTQERMGKIINAVNNFFNQNGIQS